MWVKKGLIYNVNGEFGWNQSHVYVVCADNSYKDFIRMYFSSRNEIGQSIASFIDLDANDLSKVIYTHSKPILEIGPKGTFDDCGTTPTWILNHSGKKYLYYVGWNVRKTVPYHNAIGLAESSDGTNFNKMYPGPVISTIPTEPQFNGTASVLIHNGLFKMWYLNCTEWYEEENLIEPCYHIKYAESKDGINWLREGIVAIDFKNSDEGGLSRPSVIVDENGLFKMWYSYRAKTGYRTDINKSYRIGYAESKDGKVWERMDDKVGIDLSESGWDSEMIEYPNVIEHQGKLIMFYNGNGFGKSGFGYAEWVK
jgi:hypothetical protein